MNFLTKIKLGGITNLADARYAAAAGIDYLGFCFDAKNQNFIAPIKAKEIIDWITGCEIVAEFGNQTIDEIQTISELLNVDLIELHNQILPDELSQFNKPIIKKVDIKNLDFESLKTEIEAYKNSVEMFHLFSSENLKSVDEKMLIELCKHYKIIFGFLLSPENIISNINTINPYAINLFGGSKEKYFDEMNEFLELIKDENN